MNSISVQGVRGSEGAEYEGLPPPWLWPTILSLDAPIIAVAWQLLFTLAMGAAVAPSTVVALGLSVWLIYVADRILDGLKAGPELASTWRHRFYQRHRIQMSAWFVLTAAVTAWLALRFVDPAVLRGELILAVAVAIYFAVVHFAPQSILRHWPKELAVAILFATGTTIPTWTAPTAICTRIAIPFVLFAATLWINAVGIECWERARGSVTRGAMEPVATRFLATHLGLAAVAIGAISALLFVLNAHFSAARPLYAAVAMSAFALARLESQSLRRPPYVLRALADGFLLTPFLVLPFLLAR